MLSLSMCYVLCATMLMDSVDDYYDIHDVLCILYELHDGSIV